MSQIDRRMVGVVSMAQRTSPETNVSTTADMIGRYCVNRWALKAYGCGSGLLLSLLLFASALPWEVAAQEAALNILPLRPFNFDVSFNHRTFAPTRRVLMLQAGFTALQYGPLEVRTIYQYYSHHTPTFTTDQHSLYLNPRWNNFIDVLDFPKTWPINRVIRHVLFGPLEDRAVPYLGAMLGGTLPGRGEHSPGYLYGGQVGGRFPVTHGLSVDMGLQYTRFEIDFKGQSDLSEQWLFTVGFRL